MQRGEELTPDLITELEQYRRLFNNIPAEIGVFDPEGRFQFNTPSGIRDPRMREWVLGKTHHDYCRKRNYPMAIADKRQAVIEECVAGKEAITFEEVWTDKQGGRRNYVRTFSPILDADGSVTHVLAYGQEITELEETEDELRVALAEIEVLKDRLQAENVYLQEELEAHHDFTEIVGQSAAIENLLAAVETVAPTRANVVITGETGTGKELVARAVHALSARKDKPLIKVNCASIPRELFESEFFGHVRGAFTGATDLSTAYTPGVAAVCMAIARDKSKAYELTGKGNMVAVISDGSAVLGLGNIGPEGSMPVMEGKALLFKELAGIDAWPICISAHDPDDIIMIARSIAPTFGAINLEDIAAPQCFYIEDALQDIGIPVFHDDQHGTAVVVLAAMINALKVVDKDFKDLKVVFSGAGASGIACCKILQVMGVENVTLLDTRGTIYQGRDNLTLPT